MTSTTSTTSTTTHPAVDHLLAVIEAGTGAGAESSYAADAVLDATVPGWRFRQRGAAAIAQQFTPWFADPGRFEELQRRPTPNGEVVTYLLSWEEHGVPHAAHHCHVLTLDPASGLITRDEFFCGGRWNATRLAEMAEADHAG